MNEKSEKQPIRVLIVEDDRDFAFLIEKLLRRQEDIRIAGHCAEQAEVLEAVREAKPDVVLMDLNLGKSSADGIGLSRAKAIVTRHKGRIANKYASGVITFSVLLPLGLRRARD